MNLDPTIKRLLKKQKQSEFSKEETDAIEKFIKNGVKDTTVVKDKKTMCKIFSDRSIGEVIEKFESIKKKLYNGH